MLNRTEAIVISAAVALAMVPRFEAKVEQYAKTHRTELQMAMNELQGKPAVPFAAPNAAPQAASSSADFQLASYQHQGDADEMQFDTEQIPEQVQAQVNAQVRAEVASVQPQIQAIRLHALKAGQVAEVRAQVASLRALNTQRRAMLVAYRMRAPRCPSVPIAPMAPLPQDFNQDTGSN